MDEEGEMDELNEMSLLLKGLGGGMKRRFRAFSQVQSVTCVAASSAVIPVDQEPVKCLNVLCLYNISTFPMIEPERDL